MKRRLESVPLTPEDERIFLVQLYRFPFPVLYLRSLSLKADSRDASLMFVQRRLRTCLKPSGNYIRWMDLHPAADWRAEVQ